MGRHGPEHAKLLTDHGILHVLLKLLKSYSNDKDETLDIKTKVNFI